MDEGLKWLGRHVSSIKTVLDVGASNGCWTRRCMTHFPQARYVLFEPQPVHHEALDAFEMASGQVTVVKKAVGSCVGHSLFDITDPFGGSLTQNGKADNTIKVELTTIDQSLEEMRIDGPFLMNLDTHGHERSILQGASHTLEHADILIYLSP